MKLDGTTEATLARSLSALARDERAWITVGEARLLFSTKGAQYAFGELRPNWKEQPTRPTVLSGRTHSGRPQ
jgi:hypothetical protein